MIIRRRSRELLIVFVLALLAGGGQREARGQGAPPQLAIGPSKAPPPPKLAAPGSLGLQKQKLLDALVRGHTRFALALYRRFRGKAKAGNLVFSPHSIASALSMTAAGARGKTRKALLAGLSTKLPPEKLHAAFAALLAALEASKKAGKIELRSANRLFIHNATTLRPYFPRLLKRYYGAGVERLDFNSSEAAAARINAWASKETKGLIPNVVSPASVAAARLVLGNAVYFKGQWRYKFKKKDTKPRDFFPAGRRSKRHFKAATMYQLARLPYARGRRVELLELPYRGERLSMVVVLPKRGTRLRAVEASLSAKRLDRWLRRLRRRKVRVFLPRFRIRWGRPLGRDLRARGMGIAFGGGADFSRIAGPPGWLYLSDAYHKAFVKVDEEGTEAAAVTVIVMRSLDGGGDKRERITVFRADRPFLFFILERSSREILFCGRVTTPSKAAPSKAAPSKAAPSKAPPSKTPPSKAMGGPPRLH